MKRAILFVTLFLAGCGVSRQIGDEYMGAKYVNDPLGEGRAPDTDPLIRSDAFDCTTFVETVLAHGDVDTLNKIRYKNGEIDFINRNHFIETEWLPNNANIVKNVSARYGQTALRHVAINRAAWLQRVHNIDSDAAVVETDIEYIPYDNVTTLETNRPMVVLFIVGNTGKSDIIGTDLAVVHMGFLMPNGILRHASSTAGRVVDVPMSEYIAARRQNKNNLGIALLEILK